MPAMSSVALRPPWSFFPWTRSAAVRISSSASFSFSWMSLSVATRVATVVMPRLPSSSSYTSRAAVNAALTFSRSSASLTARSTYGRTLLAAPENLSFVFAMILPSFRLQFS